MFRIKKMLSAVIFSSCVIAAGCQSEETSKNQSTLKQEQKSENKEKQKNEPSQNTGEGKTSHPNEGNGPLMMKNVQQQLGDESFTQMNLDSIDTKDIRITEIGKSLLVHFTAVTKDEKGNNVRKTYESVYSNGKWQVKDKVIITKDLCEDPDITKNDKGIVSFQCTRESKEPTLLFFNDKGEISHKETGTLVRGMNGDEFSFKSSAVRTEKGLMILTKTGKEVATLFNMNDGKEVEKIETPGLAAKDIDFINTTKKEIIASKNLYDYKKKDFVWGSDGQKLELNNKGTIIGSDKNKKYYSYDRRQREKIDGGLKSNFEVMQTKLGASDAPAFIEFTGYFNDDNSNQLLMNLSDDEIHFYGYYLFKNKPSIFMQTLAYQ